MASPTLTKAPCATCGSKSVGIFKCEGCSQIFCRKHVNEHRDNLSHQLDEIVLEHDTLQQTIAEQNDQKNYRHSLFQIDKWENNSIMKIQQAAEEAREQIEKLTNLQKGEVSKKMHDLAERLRKARIDDDYIETDLHGWTTILEKLKSDMNTGSPLITICEDSTKLIGKINVTRVMQHIEQEERFGESFGNVRIEESGQVVIHSDLVNGDGFVRGICEYASGTHKIRFTVKRKNLGYYLFFGIISKEKSIPHNEKDMKISTHGWRSNDTILPGTTMPVSEDIQDMMGQTAFEIELLLDCDNRKLSYFNQQTKNIREMNVDITLCPFPWQLLFYLYDVEDCVQLISSSQQL